MISVAMARERVRATVASKSAGWAADLDAGAGAIVSIALRPPTESQVLADQRAAEAWTREWAAADGHEGLDVSWTERSWRSIGRQRIPTSVRLTGAGRIADFAGREAAKEWRELSTRTAAVRAVFGSSEEIIDTLRRHAGAIRSMPATDFDRLLRVVEWLRSNPATGLRPRQLPIRGVDTKWVGSHRGLVTALHNAATGRGGLGLLTSDALVRVRLLDPALLPAGLTDFAAPPAELARLAISPHRILIVENLETLLSMPAEVGSVVIHGSGFAVDVAGSLPWVRDRDVTYWGDLDSHGFAILNRLRSGHPSVTSVLMDTGTLLEHRDLWVPEPAPTRGAFPLLTEEESSTLVRLREEGDVRLEQERIPLDYALERLGSPPARE